MQPVFAGIVSAFEYVELPYLQVVDRGQLQSLLQDPSPIKARWAARLSKHLYRGEVFSPTYPYPIHAWRLGKEMLVTGTGAETVVNYALRFKK